MKENIKLELKQLLIWFFSSFLILIIVGVLTSLSSKESITNILQSIVHEFNFFDRTEKLLSYLIVLSPYFVHLIVRLILFVLYKLNNLKKYPKHPSLISLSVIAVLIIFHFSYISYSNKIIRSFIDKISSKYEPLENKINPDSTNFKKVSWQRLADFDHDAFWYETIKFNNDSSMIIKFDVVRVGYLFPIKDLFNLNKIDHTFEGGAILRNNIIYTDTLNGFEQTKFDTLIFHNGYLEKLYGRY